MIHNRAADEAVLEELASFDGTVVLHCFSYPSALPAALERGYYVSFAGNATYKNASELRVAATQVPLDRILTETDAPVPHARAAARAAERARDTSCTRWRRLRATRGEEPAELAAQVDENARRAFGLP